MRRLCELVDPANAAHNPAYVWLLAPREGDEPAADQAGGANPPSLSESLLLLRLMNECPDRSAPADCGCAGLARCARSRGRQGLVNHLDCFNCLGGERTRASLPL